MQQQNIPQLEFLSNRNCQNAFSSLFFFLSILLDGKPVQSDWISAVNKFASSRVKSNHTILLVQFVLSIPKFGFVLISSSEKYSFIIRFR